MCSGTIIEIGIVGAAIVAAGAFFAWQSAGADDTALPPSAQFTSSDFDVFDRAFEMDGAVCQVGLKVDRICFGSSPHETHRYIGETLPETVPAISAEFPVIVQMSLKAEHLKTVRFGHTLALFDPSTREIMDLMDVGASDFAAARPEKSQIVMPNS